MKMIVKVIGILILAVALFLIAIVLISRYAPLVPRNYPNKVKTDGDIETKYIAYGSYDFHLLL